VNDAAGLQRLIAEYGELKRLDGRTPQSRGRRFNEVIAAMLRCWGIEAQVSVRSAGEIDVAFAVGGQRYVLEAKWERPKADTGEVAKLQRRVEQRFQGTVGLFLSMAGYSPEALDEVRRGGRLEVLLLDREHFEAMLSGLVPPQELLKLVHDRAAFRGDAHSPLLTLLTASGAAPAPSFGSAGGLDGDVVVSARPGVSCTPLFTLPGSNQLGVAARDERHLLVTTQAGVVEVDLARQRVSWAVPIPDCHRSPLPQGDGAILFARRAGIGRLASGVLSIVGGGFAGATCLLGKGDNSAWVLSNGDLSGTPGPSITRLGSGLGEEIRHPLSYPPASATNALWIDDSNLLTIGGPGFLITNLASAATRSLRASRANPMGLVGLGDNIVLIADSGSLVIADLATGHQAEVMRLKPGPSVGEIAVGGGRDLYLASYCGTGQHMRVAVAAITVPTPVADLAGPALTDARRGDLSGFASVVERIRAATARDPQETDRQRLERQYNEALSRVREGIQQPLMVAIQSSGLRPANFEGQDRQMDGWPPAGYGGSASLPRWGIDTLRVPWLAASVGVVHRVQPAEDLRDLAVTVVLARMTPEAQYDYLSRSESFDAGSDRLGEIVKGLWRELEEKLPAVLEDFLGVCASAGVPR
jgi:hypothetical protein